MKKLIIISLAATVITACITAHSAQFTPSKEISPLMIDIYKAIDEFPAPDSLKYYPILN